MGGLYVQCAPRAVSRTEPKKQMARNNPTYGNSRRTKKDMTETMTITRESNNNRKRGFLISSQEKLERSGSDLEAIHNRHPYLTFESNASNASDAK